MGIARDMPGLGSSSTTNGDEDEQDEQIENNEQ